MPRYIDADAFFADFPELRDYEYASQEYEADVVEVVRCKFCKKSGMCDLEDRGRLYDDNFYCAEGDKDDE